VTISDSELAVAAARAGAAVVRDQFGTTLTRIGKQDGDFATSADIEAERAVGQVLCAARPADAVLGEEFGLSADADRTWLVDPLCGTLNFAAGMAVVAVNVALRNGSDVTAAACADPFADEVFWTDGAGAWLRRDDADRPLVPSADTRLVDVNLDPPFPNGGAFRAARLLTEDDFGTRFRPRVVSSTLAVAWVAAGRRAAYVTDGDLRDSVHFASGIAVCRAAGCVVTDLLGQPLHTGVGGLLAAADAQTHAALLDLVRRQFAAGH
jgi:myo-inositol-1(or 4)-monophosphatase